MDVLPSIRAAISGFISVGPGPLVPIALTTGYALVGEPVPFFLLRSRTNRLGARIYLHPYFTSAMARCRD
jgi:hypothetical protein